MSRLFSSKTILVIGLVFCVIMTTMQSNNLNAAIDEKCDPSYPEVCIASPPPDLNCDDVPFKDIQVVGSDPHGFDREGDGIGCES